MNLNQFFGKAKQTS